MVIELAGKTKSGEYMWLCRCDCGNTKNVRGHSLRSGVIRSCKCLQKEIARRSVAKAQQGAVKHGHSSGGELSPTYNSWRCMITRCTYPNNDNFEHYGAKGITICLRWRDFRSFLADMGERPDNTTLHRKDETKGYEKVNCVWADSLTQRREGKSNVKLTMDKARQIRKAYLCGMRNKELAISFGVSNGLISEVVHNTKWQEANQ